MFVDNNGVLRKPVAYLADFEMFLVLTSMMS